MFGWIRIRNRIRIRVESIGVILLHGIEVLSYALRRGWWVGVWGAVLLVSDLHYVNQSIDL